MEIVLSRKQAFLEEVAKAYWELFPAKAEAVARMAREAREQLVVLTGMSAGKTLQWTMKIPTELFLFIRRYWPDFGDDPADMAMLYRLWPDLRVGQPKSKALT